MKSINYHLLHDFSKDKKIQKLQSKIYKVGVLKVPKEDLTGERFSFFVMISKEF